MVNEKHIIPGLDKGIKIYQYIGQKTGGVTQAELVAALDITPTTCYRILNTFVCNGWMVKNKDNTYDLSFGILPCLAKLTTSVNKLKCLEPIMIKLAKDTGLTSKISVIQGNEQVSILRQNSEKTMTVAVKVGSRFPVIEGSVGGALLSDRTEDDIQKIIDKTPEGTFEKAYSENIFRRIEQCRAEGFCIAGLSGNANIDAISSPLRDAKDNIVASLTVLGFKEDFSTPQQIEDISQKLLKASLECEKTLKQG